MHAPVQTLDGSDAVALAAALASSISEAHGIRTLLVKGFALDVYGLRPARRATDVDLLVEPGRFDELVELLHARGWSQRFERRSGRILPDHSVALVHPEWPCDLDLHRWFPGAFADPQVVFEAMWAGRACLPIAHIDVPIVGFAASALVGWLHAARHRRSIRHQQESASILARLRAADVEDRTALVSIAEQCGALPVLHERLADLGVDVPAASVDRESMARWQLYVATHEAGSTAAWMFEAARMPWRDRVRLAWYALYPSRADVEALHPGSTLTSCDRARYRLRRWRRAAAALPGAATALRRARRASRGRWSRDGSRSAWPDGDALGPQA